MKSIHNLVILVIAGAVANSNAAVVSAGSSTTFSFIDDVWTNGSVTQTGYLDDATSGSLTKDGITLSFQSSFGGVGVASTRNLTLDNGNPTGFVLGTNEDPNDLNGNLVNYQRWDFSFSQPILLNNLILDDIDSDNLDLFSNLDGFRDAIAAEGFTTSVPGAVGFGVDAEFAIGTGLISGVIGANGGQTLNYVIAGPADNPNNDPQHRASLSFGTTPVSSFSIYSFSDRSRSHRVSLLEGIIEVTPVPEPSGALLALTSLPLLLRRRRSA